MLKIHGFGRISSEPQLIPIGETCKIFFTVSTEEGKSGRSHFIFVEAWDSAAKYLSENAFKGDMIYIEGELKGDTREKIDGKDKTIIKNFVRITHFKVFEF